MEEILCFKSNNLENSKNLSQCKPCCSFVLKPDALPILLKIYIT